MNNKTPKLTEEVGNSYSDSLKYNVGKKYFIYDQIDHYYNSFDENNSLDLLSNPFNSIIDSIKAGVIVGPIPHNVSDTFFIDELKQVGYKKDTIRKISYQFIDKIFSKKIPTLDSSFSCVPIYRDILIFRKQSKVVGIVKLCFRCRQSKILGAMTNTDSFGEDGDYEKLSNILRQ